MTPTAVGLVLVEGHEADGEIMDQDAFDVPTRRGAAAISMSEYVAGALSRTRAIANGRRPHTIGVTWSDDSEIEASLLLKSLTDAGFDNVVPVRSPEASEALARGIGRAVGYDQTAVCLVEPYAVVISVVDTYDGTVQTVAQHAQYTCNGLIGWLTDVFDLNGWNPECLILVGPDAGLDAFTTRFERALGIPVFAPAEADLALARGAALASAQTPESGRGADDGGRVHGRKWPLPYTAAMAMLVVGVVTFVVSTSLVAGLELTSDNGSKSAPAEQPAPTPPKPAAVAVAVPPPAAPPAPVVAAPPPDAPPVVEQPAAPAHVSQRENLVNVVPEGVPAENAAPPPEAAPPPDAPPPSPEAAPPPASDAPPPAPTVSGTKPPLLTRILTHVPGLHGQPDPPADSTPPPTDNPPPPPPP